MIPSRKCCTRSIRPAPSPSCLLAVCVLGWVIWEWAGVWFTVELAIGMGSSLRALLGCFFLGPGALSSALVQDSCGSSKVRRRICEGRGTTCNARPVRSHVFWLAFLGKRKR